MGFHHIAKLAAVLLLLSACQVPVDPTRAEVAVDAEAGEVAFELAEPNDTAILVPVMIGESGPHNFVVDTGATITCVAQTLADELELRERKGISGIGATVSSSGAMRLVEIPSLTIGSIRATNVTACTIDLSQLKSVGLDADGLLGLNVLKNYLVTFDFENGIMKLDLPAASRAAM
ncbi:MAG TPA: retropepsin-like aspartic protease [Thermoanaerobaculia bacterium]